MIEATGGSGREEIMERWTMTEFYNQLQYLTDIAKTRRHDEKIAAMKNGR